MAKIKAVYFSAAEEELLGWARQHDNFSRYIKGLIRRDLETEEKGVDPRLLAMLEEVVEAKLAGRVVETEEPAEELVGEDLIRGLF